MCWLGLFLKWVCVPAAVVARYLRVTLLCDSLTRITRGRGYRLFRGSFRTGIYHVYISTGDRVRPPCKGFQVPTASGAQRIKVDSCGPSLRVCVIPRAVHVLSSRYCTRYISVPAHPFSKFSDYHLTLVRENGIAA